MNAVLSAFKSNKHEKQKSIVASKKIPIDQRCSYESLRHIRAIGATSKMMTSMINDDVEDHLVANDHSRIITIAKLVDDKSHDTNRNTPANRNPPREDGFFERTSDFALSSNPIEDFVVSDSMPYETNSHKTINVNIIPSQCNEHTEEISRKISSSPTISSCGNGCSKNSNVVICGADTISVLKSETNEPPSLKTVFSASANHMDSSLETGNMNSAANTPKAIRNEKLRMSIGVTNTSMPSIHGRGNHQNVGITTEPKQRLSTHQRNLSLDFRSMGILLPPIPIVTNARINSTQHHRNRSLDSALQRIPEVEVSSPNADNDTTFASPTMLNSTMGSAGNQQKIEIVPATIESNVKDPCKVLSSKNKAIGNTGRTYNKPKNKQREELTSLGSDDSGIICGSDLDQLSLSRVRHSRESVDSAEIDPEEESIENLDAASLDEHHKTVGFTSIQTQNPDPVQLTTYSKNANEIETNMKASKYPLQKETNDSIQSLDVATDRQINVESMEFRFDQSDDKVVTPTSDDALRQFEATIKNIPPKLENDSNKSEHVKNDLLFKNFFGATKNAIFRTAQSIIDSHEKKNALKNKSDDVEVRNPTEISRKKEFFVLKSCSNKIQKLSSNHEPIEPELKQTLKLESAFLSIKPKVPGVVKCFVKEKEQQSTERIGCGSGGLLRFFESPVFNIHFAIHYLFYSKEPGVLSFIGNKIFSFSDHDVDLYMPQLIVMYIQMDELTEVLDPYLTCRCRKSVDFSLKCLWLLEAYNYQIELSPTLTTGHRQNLSLMKELYSKKERRVCKTNETETLSPIRKTHHRSQSDATVLLNNSHRCSSSGNLKFKTRLHPPICTKLCLGDLISGKAFDSGCICFESVRGAVNGLLGQKTVCNCGAPKLAPQKEFMKALMNIGRNLTALQSKAEKTSALRMFLNLINKNLPARVWLPLYSDIPHHVVRITEEKTAVLNSKDKTPYIIYVEVVEVSDIYSSPVIAKIMPSLRHTKSEEHLELKETMNNIQSSISSTTNLSKDCQTECIRNSNNSISSSVINVGENKHLESGVEPGTRSDLNELRFTEDDVWSQEDDEITEQYMNLHRKSERDAISQMSLDSCDSRDQNIPTLFNIGDVKIRHCKNLLFENTKSFSNDPEDPSAAALKEPWHEKENQIRDSSPYGHLPNWRLLSAIVKCGDDLRQELMATQILQMFKIIWQEENVDLWVRPYKIICLSNDSGLIEPIPNTVSVHQIKKNSNKSLRDYFIGEYGDSDTDTFKIAQTNFVQSCAAYCLISYLLQVKDRHNGNILLHSDGHIIHIDFGFILNISPKNLGFEQSPFKLTAEFVDVMDGTESELWDEFNRLLLKGLMAARKHMDRIINLVEIMRSNAQLPCFKNGCSGTIQNLRKRFHMNLTEQELERKMEQLVQDSLKSLSTKLYDGYQYFTNGIL